MKKLLVSLTSASFVFITTSSQATLILYEPFDYAAGTRLGGSGTNAIGYVAPNGQTWITRSYFTNSEGVKVEARDVLITAGSLSYPGLAPSKGNSVRYGSSQSTAATNLYTDAIALPNVITEGSLYYSMIVQFHSAIPSGGGRTSYASLSRETADPLTDAGIGTAAATGVSGYTLPASAWIRNSGTTEYHLGAGKQNSDGIGPSAFSPVWQAAGTPYSNQQGNTTGAGQTWATIENNTYFIVMKYTFNNSSGADDAVSMWVNPVAATLGYDEGEALAGAAGGSYYSATNGYTTAAIDTDQIRSFMLIAVAQQYSSFTKTIDVSLDELRIGTNWADVTPLPPPQIISIAGAGTTSVTVTWTNVQIGTNYVLQYNTNLSTTNWSDLAPVTAAGTTASQTDNPPSGDATRFYRVVKP
jgi:hypothetical protein